MKNLIIALAVIYYYEQVGSVFFCHIKVKKQGSEEVTTQSCLFSNSDTLKSRLEAIEGQEVTLIKADL